MSIFLLLLTALGLSADAFAVSISNGICFAGQSHKKDIAASFSFGVFQGIMPILGFWAGTVFVDYIKQIDHWVAFVMLGFIGAKMIYEAIHEWKNSETCPVKNMTAKLVFSQSIATSIDALAVGISFAALDINIYPSSLLIACVTFICCIFGHYLGKRLGKLWGNKAQLVGGIILIAIGLNILIEHLFFM